MKGNVLFYSVSFIEAYKPLFDGLRKRIATYPLPFSGKGSHTAM